MSTIERDGKTLYRVDVVKTREAVLWILADSRDAAEADAQELAADLYDDDMVGDDDVSAVEASKPPEPETLVWSGGPDGQDISW